MRDLLRYYLQVWGCAKISVPGAELAASTFAGGVAVAELGVSEPEKFASLEAALRGYVWNGATLGDLIGRLDCKVEPPDETGD